MLHALCHDKIFSLKSTLGSLFYEIQCLEIYTSFFVFLLSEGSGPMT